MTPQIATTGMMEARTPFHGPPALRPPTYPAIISSAEAEYHAHPFGPTSVRRKHICIWCYLFLVRCWSIRSHHEKSSDMNAHGILQWVRTLSSSGADRQKKSA